MIATAALSEAAKSAWSREHGVYPAELDKWRASATAALAAPEEARASPQATRADRQRIKERWHRPQAVRPMPSRALSEAERAHVLQVANEPRFAAVPPARIVHDIRETGHRWVPVTLNPERDCVVKAYSDSIDRQSLAA